MPNGCVQSNDGMNVSLPTAVKHCANAAGNDLFYRRDKIGVAIEDRMIATIFEDEFRLGGASDGAEHGGAKMLRPLT